MTTANDNSLTLTSRFLSVLLANYFQFLHYSQTIWDEQFNMGRVLVLSVLCLLLAPEANGFGLRRKNFWKFETNSSNTNLNRSLPPDEWFVQRLNHFDNSDVRTWNQRYFVNDTFYRAGNPVFVNIGGEGTADPITIVEGQWVNFAQEFGALCLQLEHRYYGLSHPTEDMSVKNLEYLSSEQALADLANFRTSMAEVYGAEDSKWIFFGGSYSGSLAAWFSLKYPHLLAGAVASSAPLLAEVDFEEYLGVVQVSLANYSTTCNPAISAAVSQIDALLQDEAGWQTLTSKFRLCANLNGSVADDVTNLYSLLAGNFEGVVQYNKDNRAYKGAKATNVTIETICDQMDDASVGQEIDGYAAVNSLLLDAYSQSCLDVSYANMINSMRNASWDNADSGARQWIYQTCTEFGWYQSTDLAGQPFGDKFPLDFWVKQCSDVYGPKFNQTLLDEAVRQTNIIYGGKDIKARRVIFPNGSVDPWHAMGLLVDASDEAKALYISGTAHCADTYPDAPWDPPQLIEARETIRQQIAAWLSDDGLSNQV